MPAASLRGFQRTEKFMVPLYQPNQRGIEISCSAMAALSYGAEVHQAERRCRLNRLGLLRVDFLFNGRIHHMQAFGAGGVQQYL